MCLSVLQHRAGKHAQQALIAYHRLVTRLIIRSMLPMIRELCHEPVMNGVYQLCFFATIADLAAIRRHNACTYHALWVRATNSRFLTGFAI